MKNKYIFPDALLKEPAIPWRTLILGIVLIVAWFLILGSIIYWKWH